MEGWLADDDSDGSRVSDDSDGSNNSDGSDITELSVVTGMVADMLSVCKVSSPIPGVCLHDISKMEINGNRKQASTCFLLRDILFSPALSAFCIFCIYRE